VNDAQVWALLLGKGCSTVGKTKEQVDANLQSGYEAAAAEGIEGLFYRRCLEAGIKLPALIEAEASNAYRRVAENNLSAWMALSRLGASCGGNDGDFLVLPGAACLPFYPDLGCRAMDDIDLLVRPGGWHAVEKALRAIGGRPTPRHPDLWVCGTTVFDLHRDLFNCDRVRSRRWAGWLEPERVWEQRGVAVWDGLRLGVLGAEDAVLYSAAHAVRHGFRRWVWLLDLGWALNEVSWEVLLERAREARLEKALSYVLMGWRRVGGPLEPAVEQWLDGVHWGRREKTLWGLAQDDRKSGLWGDALMACNIEGGWRRLLFWGETCFPRPRVLLQVFPSLPGLLVPIGYLMRLGQLLGRAMRVLQAARRRPISTDE
jgi:hypothetical protein